jgi:hypothetical protein
MARLALNTKLATLPFNYACIIHIYITTSMIHSASILGTISLEHICVLRDSRIFSSIKLFTHPGGTPEDARTFLPRSLMVCIIKCVACLYPSKLTFRK